MSFIVRDMLDVGTLKIIIALECLMQWIKTADGVKWHDTTTGEEDVVKLKKSFQRSFNLVPAEHIKGLF